MSAFVHLELGTDDTKKASEFYKKVFGWKLTPMKMPDGSKYVMFDTQAGGPGGGIGGKMDPSQPTAWLPYLGVQSLDKTVAKARKLGATIVVDRMPVMDMGALAILVDPTGATVGLWEPAISIPTPPKTKAKKGAAKKGTAKKGTAKKGTAKKGTAKKGATKKGAAKKGAAKKAR